MSESENPRERLSQAIDRQQRRLRMDVPSDREVAVLALVRAQDRLPDTRDGEPPPDLLTGRRIADLGGNKALRLCLESADDVVSAATWSVDAWDTWAERFLDVCGRLAEAELVLGYCESGFMRLVDDGDGTFHAWTATKRAPTSWRERADIDWWAAWLAKRYEPELRALESARPDPVRVVSGDAAYYRRLADVHLAMMAYQFGYPPEAAIAGCSVRTYRDVLGLLIAWALRARDFGEALAPQPESALVTALASALAADPAVIGLAVAEFTLDRENAAWHGAVPGVAAPPLMRVGSDRLVWSVRGLTTEPFFFLTREMRRRDAAAYNNSAHLREDVFRHDLYALFADKRFVTSAGRVKLRREGGDVRTDVDAVVFDRKTGTLGLFELKSQDPFARSTAELTRQRDNVLYANRQVSGMLAWLQRHGGDEILRRVDPGTAKTFRVQKVFPFVLGRYLVHFGDGPEPDRRAAWGTWPQVLRLLDEQPLRGGEANPLASLFTRLQKDVSRIRDPEEEASREITLGDARLMVHSSYAAFQGSAAGSPRHS